MRGKMEFLVGAAGVGITTITGSIVILGLDAIVGIVTALAAGAGHDPGASLSTMLWGAPLCGSAVALLCTIAISSWLVREQLRKRDSMAHSLVFNLVFNKINYLIVIVGILGMTIVVGLKACIVLAGLYKHVSAFLGIGWQSVGHYISDIITWYIFILIGAAFLCGFLTGLLGIAAGAFSGGFFGVIANLLVSKIKR